jgi:hypothetical protein
MLSLHVISFPTPSYAHLNKAPCRSSCTILTTLYIVYFNIIMIQSKHKLCLIFQLGKRFLLENAVLEKITLVIAAGNIRAH